MNAPTKRASPVVPFKRALMDLIVQHGKVKAVGKKKPVSNRTQDLRESFLFLMFKQLKEMGFKMTAPSQLREWHVKKLVERWENEGLAAATLQSRLSMIRMFAAWIGKPGLVRSTVEYVKNPANARRSANATKDKSWEASDIDVDALIQRVGDEDPYVGIQMRLMHAFGLRREEAVMFKPHRADLGDFIAVRDGTKGGRDRNVRIDHEWQREILDSAKAMVPGVNGHVGRPGKTLKQALRRFNYMAEKHGITGNKLGITSHGLRHGRLNNLFEEVAGIPAPVRMDMNDPEQVRKLREADPMKLDLARAAVSTAAGHNRLDISNAYTGSLPQAKRKSAMSWEIPPGITLNDDVKNWLRLRELQQKSDRTTDECAELNGLQCELGIVVVWNGQTQERAEEELQT